MGAALRAFGRRKNLSSQENLTEKLPRVLTSFDLTYLGIGSTLGAGVYVVATDIAKNTAGPGAIFSFLIAAFASGLCGLCYAEFGARVPKAGSAYTYTYVTIGELSAFLIGWNLLLEYMIGAAAVARAWTSYIDSIANKAISRSLMNNVATWTTPGISEFPDFVSFGICLLVAAALVIGVRISSWLNTLMTALNLLVIFFIIVLGMMLVDTNNWSPFLPFGIRGVLKGSATAFFAFVGFETIATSGEEVKDPAKAIPKAIFSSLGVSFLAYGSLILTVTLIVSYKDLDDNAAIPNAFSQRGLTWAKYVIASGGIAGLTSSLISTMFAVPRLLFSMSDDGLLFSPFGRINTFTKTPVFGTIFTGLITGWLAMYFDLSTLVEMMSIGTLQAYTMVATCVLLMRYQVAPVGMVHTETGFQPITNDSLVNETERVRMSPTKRSAMLATMATFVIIVLSLFLSCLFIYAGDKLLHGYFWAIVSFFTFLGALTVAITVIVLQPQNKHNMPFTVPLVPLLPVVSIFINISLMMELSPITWARFGLWMFLGKHV